MILGILAIWLGMGAILTAMIAYALAMRDCLAPAPVLSPPKRKSRGALPPGPSPVKGDRLLRLARRAFYTSAGCIFVASAVFMTLILLRRYEIAYIFEHTGNDLALKYRIASFWGGQEGTFLLWAIYGSVLGLLLIPRSRDFERFVMPFFCGVQCFLLLLLTVMSPFKLISEQPVATGWPGLMQMFGLAHVIRPADGQGLTPLLQNYWMVIHPPIVFVGFATLAIPACFALGALMKRDYDNWVTVAAPWATFGWAILGVGIFLGGYWAYETLGWGGYWAWDPVENASLVPWVFATAALHGMLAQRARNSLKQANLFLAMTAFFAVLYGTFLTRSGVLGDFSVHSFVAPGRLVYLLMVAVLVGFAVGGIGLWFRRLKEIQGESAYDSLTERHFGLFLATVLLIGSAIIIALGMSFPLLAPFFIGKKGSLSVVAYNRAMVPIGTFVALLIAATPMMPWRHADGIPRPWKWSQKLVYGLCFGILAAGAVAAVIAWTGVRPQAPQLISTAPAGSMDTSTPIGPFPPDYPALAVFAAAAVLALCVNVCMFFKTIRFGVLTTGAWVAHTGISLVLLAVLVTSIYSKSTPILVEKGQTAQAFGYQFTYLGKSVGSGVEGDRDHLKFEVRRGDDRMIVRLPYYTATMPGGDPQLIRNPAIRKYWNHDLYVSANQQSNGTEGIELEKGQTGRAAGYTIKFAGFDVAASTKRGHGEGPIEARAVLEVSKNGKTSTLRPAFIVSPNDTKRIPVTIPGGDYMVSVWKIIPEGAGRVQLIVTPLHPTDMASIDVSYKPFINVLWMGGLFMGTGMFLAWRRRSLLARKAAQREEERATAPAREPLPRRIPERRPVPVTASSKR